MQVAQADRGRGKRHLYVVIRCGCGALMPETGKKERKLGGVVRVDARECAKCEGWLPDDEAEE